MISKYPHNSIKNILICIYADNDYGNAMANDNNFQINSEKHKKAWLAMYSYNEVEGEYFDDNPTRYIGVY